MITMTRTFAAAGLMSLLACTSSNSNGATGGATDVPSEADSATGGAVATVGITDSSTATESVVAIHKALQELAASATDTTKADTVNLTIACDVGAATSTLTVTQDGAGTVETQHRFQFHACRFGDETMSGSLEWSSLATLSPSGGHSWVRFDGTLAYEGPTFAGTYGFDALQIETESTRAGATYSVTGSYSVGAMAYSIDETRAIDFFQ
ncbi:MAG: hypothetical protein IV100_17965 [Myxococcales bacterium]|nr:hypothetical protein [Myxococcales bacterium]